MKGVPFRIILRDANAASREPQEHAGGQSGSATSSATSTTSCITDFSTKLLILLLKCSWGIGFGKKCKRSKPRIRDDAEKNNQSSKPSN
jgi:hypothetical protein